MTNSDKKLSVAFVCLGNMYEQPSKEKDVY